MWTKIKRFFVKPKLQELDLKSLEGIKAFCDLYHGAVRKYGDDGHDQFVELIERVQPGHTIKGDHSLVVTQREIDDWDKKDDPVHLEQETE